jgi:predicted NAD-dependent protein-ADP-ribosyltransferase YbiA (DUF1768 family)
MISHDYLIRPLFLLVSRHPAAEIYIWQQFGCFSKWIYAQGVSYFLSTCAICSQNARVEKTQATQVSLFRQVRRLPERPTTPGIVAKDSFTALCQHHVAQARRPEVDHAEAARAAATPEEAPRADRQADRQKMAEMNVAETQVDVVASAWKNAEAGYDELSGGLSAACKNATELLVVREAQEANDAAFAASLQAEA